MYVSPISRNNKIDWFNTHKNHCKIASTTPSDVALFGDSLVVGLSRFPFIWQKYFNNIIKAVNFGISGDKTQHVLWRANNINLNNKIKIIVIHCGTNNIDNNTPRTIVDGLISIANSFLKGNPNMKVIITGLLPRDLEALSIRRTRIMETNDLIKYTCENSTGKNSYFLEQDENWIDAKGKLNTQFFHTVYLHLSKSGYDKLARTILNKIVNITNHIKNVKPPSHHVPSFALEDDYVIGQSEYLGRGWDGPTSIPHRHPSSPNSTPYFNSNLCYDNFPSLPYTSSETSTSNIYLMAPCYYKSAVSNSCPFNYLSMHDFPQLPKPSTTISHNSFSTALKHYPISNTTATKSKPSSAACLSPHSKSSSPINKMSYSSTSAHSSSSFQPTHSLISVPDTSTSLRNHITPLRKINRVKIPKWEKWDYVYPPAPISPFSSSRSSSSSSSSFDLPPSPDLSSSSPPPLPPPSSPPTPLPPSKSSRATTCHSALPSLFPPPDKVSYSYSSYPSSLSSSPNIQSLLFASDTSSGLHNDILPLRKINRVKIPKWEKCDYVYPPTPLDLLSTSTSSSTKPISSRLKSSPSPTPSSPSLPPPPFLTGTSTPLQTPPLSPSPTPPASTPTPPPTPPPTPTPSSSSSPSPPISKTPSLSSSSPLVSISISIFLLFMVSFYYLYKFYKYFYKHILFLIFIYISLNIVIQNNTNVRFVNNIPNSNLNTLINVNNYNNSLFSKANTYELHFYYYYYKYDTSFSFKPSPWENSRIDFPCFFSLLWFLFIFKLKKNRFCIAFLHQ